MCHARQYHPTLSPSSPPHRARFNPRHMNISFNAILITFVQVQFTYTITPSDFHRHLVHSSSFSLFRHIISVSRWEYTMRKWSRHSFGVRRTEKIKYKKDGKCLKRKRWDESPVCSAERKGRRWSRGNKTL